MADTDDIQILQELLIENLDLELLENQVDRFNLFEIIGAVGNELRHSNFLAYLLSPNQGHGLGTIFLKRFLQSALSTVENGVLGVRPIDIELWDFDQVDVRREWHNIDLLLVDEINHFVVIIENKIHSGEHSNQLFKYWTTGKSEFPGWTQIGIFLTPEGIPAKEDDQYLSVSYQSICEILERIIESKKDSINPDVYIAVNQYTQMLRRHIVSESEIAELCRKIYQKHQRALDLIFEYRSDRQSIIRDFFIDIINNFSEIEMEHSIKSEIRFTPKKWNDPYFSQGAGWIPSNKILVFAVQNSPIRVRLILVIGPGEHTVRQQLMNMAFSNQNLFHPSFRQLNQKWNTIYSRTFLSKKDLEETDDEVILSKLQMEWEKFMKQDYISIVDFVQQYQREQ